MVFRIFVEKREGLANEAKALLTELRNLLGMKGLKNVRLFNRYDVENIAEDLFADAVNSVFSEPQLDIVTKELPTEGDAVFAVEYLPGQFDQRADSAAQCIQIISCGERPTIRTARVYVLEGDFTADELAEIKKYVINPVKQEKQVFFFPKRLPPSTTFPPKWQRLTASPTLTKRVLLSL